jgi:2-amino-4-hydroxy-6-hydroxymethyldihydropteridine diphosphokinase
LTSVFVAAGSNVEPEKNLRTALDVLDTHFAPLRVSRAYRNAAVGFAGDDFINLVVAFETALSIHEVIERLHEAEAACGRERGAPKWAPRAMDLDILLYDELVCDEPGLKLPRPDLVRRPYMLGPAAELAPDLVHPTQHVPLGTLWQAMQDSASHPMTAIKLEWRSASSAAAPAAATDRALSAPKAPGARSPDASASPSAPDTPTATSGDSER